MSPPTTPLEFIHVSSITAAIAKLNLNVPLKDILKAILDEEAAKRAKETAEKRRAALSKLALEPIDGPPVGVDIIPTSKFIPAGTKPPSDDPLWRERARRLLELTKEAFPYGKVPDPLSRMLPQ